MGGMRRKGAMGRLGVVVLAVAVLGLAVNLVSLKALHVHSHDNLNMRGAFLEVLGDVLGSAGVIVAAVVILLTGWTLADPLVSVLIGVAPGPRR